MRRRPAFFVIITFLALATSGLVTVAQRAAPPPRRPGTLGNGVTQLPNGWRIAPTGRHAVIGDLPLNMVWSPDGRYLIVTNNGWSKPTLTIFDTANFYIRSTVSLEHAWLGLAWHPDGKRLYSSGAAQNVVNELTWNGEALKPGTPLVIGEPVLRPTFETLKASGFVGGVAVSPDGARVYAVQVFGESISSIDIQTRKVLHTASLGAEPYSVLPSPDGKTVFVSVWGGARVVMLDPSLQVIRDVAVGEHPNAMVLSRDGTRLFVACANTNAVWVVDVESGRATEQIGVALFPDAPPGTTPNALALSPDGSTMLVANADNNTIAVVDVSEVGDSQVRGFIPTGWYPTSVTYDRDGRRIFVLNGKGLAPSANPRGPGPGTRGAEGQYIAQLLQGALSEIAVPDAQELARLTARVYELTPYSDKTKLTPANAPIGSPIPGRVGAPSPIKHVFYIVRENRTYDQVLGDIETGNGDPTLTLFGEQITPNAHAIAREFVLLDNFYVDAEVSYDGHAFSMGAYATDAVEKIWPTNYGQRGGIYLSEGGGGQRNPYGNLSAPPQGYIWDMAKRAGVSVRSYGEFVDRDRATGRIQASVPGLEGLFNPDYAPYDLNIPDNDRVDVWLKEFREFERRGTVPRLNIIRLGNDHTAGTRPTAPTPRAMVAENDLALGRVVEAISRSAIWKESAIFVVEDDAQNGPDHVDAHRAPTLVISPFARRRAVDSTMYSTSSVLRTMELVLGMEPMTQYDASATPMYNSFQTTPVLTPYTALPVRVPLDEKNGSTAWGAEASLRMNLEEADMAPEIELNEILWRSIRGANSPMPPPRRAAFVRPVEVEGEK